MLASQALPVQLCIMARSKLLPEKRKERLVLYVLPEHIETIKEFSSTLNSTLNSTVNTPKPRSFTPPKKAGWWTEPEKPNPEPPATISQTFSLTKENPTWYLTEDITDEDWDTLSPEQQEHWRQAFPW